MSWDYNPFAERPQPPMSASMFTTLVGARLRAVPQVEIVSQRELELRVRVGGRSTTIRLEQLYQEYHAEPAKLEALLATIVADVATPQYLLHANERTRVNPRAAPDARPHTEPNSEFETIAPHLFPLLLNEREWQQKYEQGITIIARAFVEDLGIGLVIDEPESITFVEYDAIPRWGVEATTLFETAMANLEQNARQRGFSQTGAAEEKVLIDRATDGYAATRVILPSRVEDWSSRVPGELVVGLPSRDFLIGFSAHHPALAALQAQIELDAQTHPHSLSARLFVFRHGELQVYRKAGQAEFR
jgi:hypothetical protein